jgi:D-lyxose ketol-isomerase
VSVQPLRVGESFDVSFQQRAKAPVHVQQVTAKLICREFATYRRGTDTTTVNHDVYEQKAMIAEEVAASSIQPIEGTASLTIPADGMHSFQASRNRIVWLLELKTVVDDWPDYTETFEVHVAPERVIAGEAV